MRTLVINAILVAVLLSLPFTTVAQTVCLWDVAEDTNMMQFDMQRPLAASSADDIAQIGLPIGGSSFGRVVRHSSDSGRSWTTLFSKKQAWDRWNFIVHSSPTLYVVCGDTEDYYGSDKNGNYQNRYTAYFLISNDGGVTWRQSYLDSNTIIGDLKMLSDTYGVALLHHSSNIYDSLPASMPDDLLITSDGWKTWTTRPFPAGMRGFQHIFCFEKDRFGVTSYATAASNGDSSDYLKTTDGGKSWTKIGSMPFSWGVCFINENVGWAAGTDWSVRPQQPFIAHTTDGGTSWNTQFHNNPSIMKWGEGLSEIVFFDSLHGVAAGSRLFETKDGGQTWTWNQPPFEVWSRPNGGINLKGLVMPSASFALATCGSPVIRYSGKRRLDAPIFNKHEPGPLPIEPTTISWSRIQGAATYQLQLAVDPPWAGSAQKIFNTIELDTATKDTFFTFVPRAGEAYYARVRAINEGISSDWRWNGEWYQLIGLFTTVHKAGAALPPKILAPGDGAHSSNELYVKWTSVEGAKAYKVQCWLESMFVTDSAITTDTFTTFKGLSTGFNYYVVVRAYLSDDTTDPSQGVWVAIEANSGVTLSNSEHVTAFPNPAHNIMHLVLPQDARMSQFELYDELGQSRSIDAIRETSGVRLDIHSLPAGLYTLMLPGSGCKPLRIVVEH